MVYNGESDRERQLPFPPSGAKSETVAVQIPPGTCAARFSAYCAAASASWKAEFAIVTRPTRAAPSIMRADMHRPRRAACPAHIGGAARNFSKTALREERYWDGPTPVEVVLDGHASEVSLVWPGAHGGNRGRAKWGRTRPALAAFEEAVFNAQHSLPNQERVTPRISARMQISRNFHL